MGKLCGYFCIQIAIFLMHVSGQHADVSSRRRPILSASPGVIILGVTPTLVINCSYPSIRSHDLATLTSLNIYSRTNSSARLHKLGVVKVTGDNKKTKTFVSKNAEGAGVIDDKGESFLCLSWIVPSRDQVADYLCLLNAENVDGVQVQSRAGTRVTSRTPWHIREIQLLEDGYKKLLQRVTSLEEIIDLKSKGSIQRHRVQMSRQNIGPYTKDTQSPSMKTTLATHQVSEKHGILKQYS